MFEVKRRKNSLVANGPFGGIVNDGYSDGYQEIVTLDNGVEVSVIRGLATIQVRDNHTFLLWEIGYDDPNFKDFVTERFYSAQEVMDKLQEIRKL